MISFLLLSHSSPFSSVFESDSYLLSQVFETVFNLLISVLYCNVKEYL